MSTSHHIGTVTGPIRSTFSHRSRQHWSSESAASLPLCEAGSRIDPTGVVSSVDAPRWSAQPIARREGRGTRGGGSAGRTRSPLALSPLAPSCMCILSVSPLSCPIVAGVRKAQSIHEAGAPTPAQEV